MEKLKNLRKNLKGEVGIRGIIATGLLLVISLVVILALLPTLQTGVDNAQANVTDPAADSMLGLVMLLVVVAVILIPIVSLVMVKFGDFGRGG